MKADNPLLKMPNVVVLPHIASASIATRTRMEEIAADVAVAGALGKNDIQTPSGLSLTVSKQSQFIGLFVQRKKRGYRKPKKGEEAAKEHWFLSRPHGESGRGTERRPTFLRSSLNRHINHDRERDGGRQSKATEKVGRGSGSTG